MVHASGLVLAFSLVVFGQSGHPQVASGTGRPTECGVRDGARAPSRWERAKEPTLQAYCALLASGAAKLVSGSALAEDVATLADDAEKLLPGRAAPSALKGRALLRLGKPSESVAALKEARARDDRALDDPVVLLAWARANARTGHFAEAARAYREALPRTSALSTSERSAVAFETAMVVMALGPEAIDDAVAVLRQGRREAHGSMYAAYAVALALALDRAGQPNEAKALLAERVSSNATLMISDRRVTDALADAGVSHESNALLATALELTDPDAAREAWHHYLEAQGGASRWVNHARTHELSMTSRSARKESSK